MVDPVIAQASPFGVEVEQGKTYAWCACGRSANQPFCDGSHKGGPFSPVVFKAEKSGMLHFCGCKRTKTRPFCDGTHKSL